MNAKPPHYSPNRFNLRALCLVVDLRVSFVAEFQFLAARVACESFAQPSVSAARASAHQNRVFHSPISPRSFPRRPGNCLNHSGRRSQQITQQRFGKVIRFFAPLYLSNECINNCPYCGFSRDNPILRVTLSVDEVVREARRVGGARFSQHPARRGRTSEVCFQRLYGRLRAALHQEIPSISLEVGPMETDEYRPFVEAGAEGLVVYQETYDREFTRDMHTAGPKRNFDWRLETPERAYAAGFRRLGIGALYGLSDWRYEALVCRRACRLSAATMLESAGHDFLAAIASLRRRIPTADSHE